MQQSLDAASRASRHNSDNIYINCFGGLEIIGPNGKLTGDDIKTDQGFLLLAYLILNRRRTLGVDELSRVIHHFGDSDVPYKVLSNIVYRIRRPLAIIGPGQAHHRQERNICHQSRIPYSYGLRPL